MSAADRRLTFRDILRERKDIKDFHLRTVNFQGMYANSSTSPTINDRSPSLFRVLCLTEVCFWHWQQTRQKCKNCRTRKEHHFHSSDSIHQSHHILCNTNSSDEAKTKLLPHPVPASKACSFLSFFSCQYSHTPPSSNSPSHTTPP